MQKIRPFLWFDDQAEAAAKYYTSIFPHSTITDVRRYGGEGPGTEGSVMSVTFELEGQEFIALNGGPEFAFSPAISFFVTCETQEEIDRYWDRLSSGGRTMRCGWLTDAFGVTWQIVPARLGELLQGEDDAKSSRAMKAMLHMDKLDIAALQRAYDEAS